MRLGIKVILGYYQVEAYFKAVEFSCHLFCENMHSDPDIRDPLIRDSPEDF